MNTIFTHYQTAPLGKQLATENWESFVYELGEQLVYKEIKTENDLNPGMKNYEERCVLQQFWCSETHFENMSRDNVILQDKLSSFYPESISMQTESRFHPDKTAIVTIQRKIEGSLLLEMDEYQSESLSQLHSIVADLTSTAFKAPLDFHPGNIMLEKNTDALYFFDTGTPSDWAFFLDAKKLQSAIPIENHKANMFVEFMKPIYKIHKSNCNMN